MQFKNKHLLVLSGPTASGKSQIALDLALAFDTEIISTDSRQIYREMSIGTAKPSQSDLQKVKHHFIDHLSVQDIYSAGKFSEESRAVLEDLFKSKDLVIAAGGTGFYIKALTEGLPNIPSVPHSLIEEIEYEFTKGTNTLLEELKSNDEAYYNTADLSNKRRLVRALAVIRHTGKPFSQFLNQTIPPLPYTIHQICLSVDKELLNRRINDRVEQMFESGLVEEVRELIPYKNLKALQTVGYYETFKFLDDQIDLEECKTLIKNHTRQYAKRQRTWCRNQGNWMWKKPEELTVEWVKSILKNST